MGLLDIYDAQLQSGLNVSEPPPIQVWQTITLAPTKVWMLIATQWIQRGLKCVILPTKSSVGQPFLCKGENRGGGSPAFRLRTRRGNGIFAFRCIQARKANWT